MSNDLTVPIDWPIVKPGESLYTAKVPGSLHLSADEDWDVFTERLKAASTYDGFIAKYHFVERD